MTVRPAGRKSAPWWALLCISVLGIVTGCRDWSPNGLPGNGEFFDGLFTVESSLVGEEPMVIEDLVSIGGWLVALASTHGALAGTILRSDDGGLSWSQSQDLPPLDGADAPEAGVWEANLIVAGSWLVAVRSTDISGELSGQQAVAISRDHGVSWQPLDLPVPIGMMPLVWTATDVDGRLVLGGANQVAGRLVNPDILDHALDAALWITDLSAAPDAEPRMLAASQFQGVPFNQEITELLAFDGRLIAVGEDSAADPYNPPSRVAWESRDRGVSWSPMAGLPVPEDGYHSAAIVSGGTLVLPIDDFRMALAKGTSTWVRQRLPDGFPFDADGLPSDADEVTLPDGSVALTWTAWECDDGCPTAYGGRVEDGTLNATELSFDDCDNDLEEGTKVHAPGRVGDQVIALADCYDGDDFVSSLAVSQDGGLSWATARLTEFAPPGRDLSFYDANFLFLADDGVLVALMSVTGTDSPDGAQIVALRISATN